MIPHIAKGDKKLVDNESLSIGVVQSRFAAGFQMRLTSIMKRVED
jgi:hypothetical protein